MKLPINVAQKIIDGGVGVMPTDTIYGVVASTKFPNIIERIYDLKDRGKHKPFIVLISGYDQLKSLGIVVTDKQITALQSLWPGPNSVILPCDDTVDYIHLGFKSLAVRMPSEQWLLDMISRTGPVVATSANLSGEDYVGDITHIKHSLPGLDFYIEGPTGSTPSNLVKISDSGNIQILPRTK